MAWTAPSAVVAIAAPAYATSHGDTTTPPDIGSMNLGMNGLLQVQKDCATGKIDLDASLSTSYGFYVVGATKEQTPSNARFTCYYPARLGEISWTKVSGDGWTVLTRDTAVAQYSGYYAYTSTYSGKWTYAAGTERWDAATKPHWTSKAINLGSLGYCRWGATIPTTSLRRVTVAGRELSIQRSVRI